MIRYHDDARRLLKRLDLIRPHYRNPITEDIDDVNAHIDSAARSRDSARLRSSGWNPRASDLDGLATTFAVDQDDGEGSGRSIDDEAALAVEMSALNGYALIVDYVVGP